MLNAQARGRNAQVSIEFMLIIGFLMIVLIGFVVGIMRQHQEIREDKEYVIVRDIAFKIKDEIDIAYKVQPVYTRNFTLPRYIEGIEYSINITDGLVIVTSGEQEFSLSTASGTGCLSWGNNSISKLANGTLVFKCQE